MAYTVVYPAQDLEVARNMWQMEPEWRFLLRSPSAELARLAKQPDENSPTPKRLVTVVSGPPAHMTPSRSLCPSRALIPSPCRLR